jgi:hypothetical protein
MTETNGREAVAAGGRLQRRRRSGRRLATGEGSGRAA